MTTTSKAKPKDIQDIIHPCCLRQYFADVVPQPKCCCMRVFAHRRANTGRKEQTLSLASCATSILEASVWDADDLVLIWTDFWWSAWPWQAMTMSSSLQEFNDSLPRGCSNPPCACSSSHPALACLSHCHSGTATWFKELISSKNYLLKKLSITLSRLGHFPSFSFLSGNAPPWAADTHSKSKGGYSNQLNLSTSAGVKLSPLAFPRQPEPAFCS